jgi:hypothetical protein
VVDPDLVGTFELAEAQAQIVSLFAKIQNPEEFYNNLGPHKQEFANQAWNRGNLFVEFGNLLAQLAPPQDGIRTLTPQEREKLLYKAVEQYQLLGGVLTEGEDLQLVEHGLTRICEEVNKFSRRKTSQPTVSTTGATFGFNKANGSRSGKKRADLDPEFTKEIKDHIEKDGGNDFLVKLNGRDDAVILREKGGSKQVIAVNEGFENLNKKFNLLKAENFTDGHLDNLGDYFGLADDILEVSFLDNRQEVGKIWGKPPAKPGFPDLPVLSNEGQVKNAGGISINNKNEIKISILDAGEANVESVFYVRPSCTDKDLIPFPVRLEIFYSKEDGVQITAINGRGDPVGSDFYKNSGLVKDKKILDVLNGFSVEINMMKHEKVQNQDKFTPEFCHKKSGEEYDKRIGLDPNPTVSAVHASGFNSRAVDITSKPQTHASRYSNNNTPAGAFQAGGSSY